MEQGETIKKKQYFKDPEDVVELANKVIREQNIELEDASVGYILVDPKVGGNSKVAKFVKSNPEVQLYSGHQYIIELSMDVWDMIQDDLRYKILEHNLRRIFVDINDKTGEFEYKEIKPDIQEYFTMLNAYDVSWISDLKTITESVRQLDVLERVDY